MTRVDHGLVPGDTRPSPAVTPDAVGAAPAGVRGGMANLTERELTAAIVSLLNGLASMPDELGAALGSGTGLEEEEEEATCVQSLLGMEAADFREDGTMSSNEGLTVRLPDGSRFQLTVVRSR